MKIRKIKTLLTGGLLLLISFPAFSQLDKVKNMPAYDHAKYHFGFILAVNQMHFSIRPVGDLNYSWFDSIAAEEINADSAKVYSVEHGPSTGFTVGIVANLRLGNYFDLRFIPSLAFGERKLEYRFLKYREGQSELVEIDKNVPSTFIELPLHLKYKSQRLNNFRAYVLSGVNYRIDLASQASKDEEAAEVQIKLLPHDLYGEIGVGFDFYFEWFKFGTELKMSYGVIDILKREGNIYTDGIDQLRSKLFQLSFTFE